MPTVTLNKEAVEKLVGKKLPVEKLKDRITMIGTALEKIEGNEIVVEVFPNRPDFLSEPGLARALSSFFGVKTGLKEYNVEKSGEKVIVENSVKDVRPYTACAIVKGMKFDQATIAQIIQIQEKLHVTFGRNRKKCAIGIYPFEKIKMPVRFMAKSPKEIKFQPLDFFKELDGIQILGQHPTGKEYAHLLEGMEKFPIFIDSNNSILSMPPIINSEQVGKVTEKTTDVFIECSGFSFEVVHKCLCIICAALADLGGKIFSVELEMHGKKITTPSMKPSEMKISAEYASRILGFELKEQDIKKYLEMMGHGYSKGKALVPSYRADILHPIDLVEDIGIAYGYENMEEEIPKVATIAEENPIYVFKERIADMLAGLGMLEVKTYHLAGKEDQSKKMGIAAEQVALMNPSTKEYDVLRSWIIPCLLDVLAKNKHHEYPQNIFDMGAAFTKGKTDTGVEEFESLAAALCSESSDFTSIKQVMDYIMRMIGIEYEVVPAEHKSFIPGRVGKVCAKGKEFAFIGEISPEILSQWEIAMPVSAMEINISVLFEIMRK